jgi:hypothetical protein
MTKGWLNESIPNGKSRVAYPQTPEPAALRFSAEAGDGDIRADPPLTEEDRQRLGLTERSILDDPRFAFLKERAAAGIRKP